MESLQALLFGVLLLGVCFSAPTNDLVDQVPDFKKTSFKVYSGYLNVPGPVSGFSSLKIHYQFHESQNDPAKDPVATWHQGGPGGTSLYGLYGEMGYFQVDDAGTHVNEFAWNKVANMLYLESPAGSSNPIGFSTCSIDGKVQSRCSFDDKSQAEAYAHTLRAFFKAFPEYSNNSLYLTGESYAGQYLPNIANFIVNNDGFGLNLKGIAVGNGCWGGTATSVQCNGPNSRQNDVDMYFGKGLASKTMYDSVYKTCGQNWHSSNCENAVQDLFHEVGPHNTYNIYDNCPRTAEFLKKSNKTMYWLHSFLRDQLDQGFTSHQTSQNLQAHGGYDWSCGAMDKMVGYLKRNDVQKALHISNPGESSLSYSTSGPASMTLYPSLAQKIRILIYNGDADACVPYKGNEEFIDAMTSKGQLKVNKAWHPWYADGAQAHVPAGYATTYTVPNSKMDFSFVTIRLAGHMVPTFQPNPSLSFISTFFAGTPF